MPISLVLDIIIAVLLVLTIAYAVRLNQRLLQLRSDKNELLELAKTFASATVRAETAIANLKVSSESLTTEVTKAEALKDDLAYLVSRGGRTADEMVDSVRGKGKPPPASATPLTPSASRGKSMPKMDNESRLIEDAIRAATPTPGENDDEPSKPQSNTRRITGLLGAKTDRSAPVPELARSAPPVSSRTSSSLSASHAEDRLFSSRDLNSGFEGGDESIGDTDAARELLKALGSVK